MITTLSREDLYSRHQLSHDQIDDILGERRSIEFPECKAQHLGKMNAFWQICSLLKEAGIPFIPQKGPVLSYRLKGDPLYRTFVDLDFYIEEYQIAQTVNLLLSNGFITPFYTVPQKECKRRLLFKHVNEVILLHEGWSVNVELHWNLFNCKTINNADFILILEDNNEIILFEDQQFKVFNNELEVLYLVIHGTLHGWSKLKWLFDVRNLLRKFKIQESRFISLVRKYKAGRPVAICNELLKVFFPESNLLPSTVKAPKAMVKFAMRQIMQPLPINKYTEFIGFFINSWRSFPGFGYKTDLVKRILFATDLANVSWMPCSVPVYYCISPFWKLIRGFRG